MRMPGSTFARLAVALVLSVIASSVPDAACAQTVRWKEYLHPDKPSMKQLNEIYLAGVKDGLIAYSVATHDKTTMCLPQNSVLTTEQLDGIMKRWAATQAGNPNLEVMPIGLIAINALRKEYPCP